MRNVTYCERDVTYRGGGSDTERDKGFFSRARCITVTVPELVTYRNVPWCNGQRITLEMGLSGFESWREHFFFGMLIFLPCTKFSGSACSPGQNFTWMLNHQCGDMFCVGTLRCT